MTYSSFQLIITCQILIIQVEVSHGRCLSQAGSWAAVDGESRSATTVQPLLEIGQKPYS